MMTHLRRAALAAALLSIAGPARAQDDLGTTLEARRGALKGAARSFHETWLLPARGESAPNAQATVFAGRVSVWQHAPRERIEIFPAVGGELGEPIVIVSDGTTYHLVTAVGATPLARSAKARERLVRLVLAGPPADAERYRVVSAAAGGVAAVVLRQPMPAEFDAERAFALRLPRAGGGVLAAGLSQFSPAGDPEVTAAAGARGVDRVRTANGEVPVTPDPEAVAWMEGRALTAAELEAFKREAGLPPYDALPPEARSAADSTAGGGAR